MSNNHVQNIVTNAFTHLFTDAATAGQYAIDPKQYLADTIGDEDLSGLDLPAAINDAATAAEVSPEMSEALNTAIYQPAAAIRVPVAKVERHDVEAPTEYDLKQHEAAKVDKYDQYDKYDHVEIEDAQYDEANKYEIDRDDIKLDEVDKYDYVDIEDAKYDDVQQYEVDHRDITLDIEPPHVNREPMDDGDYRAELPENYDHEVYVPEHYTPEAPCDIDSVEYSVSNCVTTMYADHPEVADTLCETRNWEDPYVRHDPAHDVGNVMVPRSVDHMDDQTEDRMDDRTEMGRREMDDSPMWADDEMEMDVEMAPTYPAETPEYADTEHYVDTPEYADTPKYVETPEYAETEQYVDTPKYAETEQYVEVPHAPVAERPVIDDDCDDTYGAGREAPMHDQMPVTPIDTYGTGSEAPMAEAPMPETTTYRVEVDEAPVYVAPPVEEYEAPIEHAPDAVEVYEVDMPVDAMADDMGEEMAIG